MKGLLREALDAPAISNLAAVYRRPGGPADAAQALNLLTSPLAADCGRRYWVPELVDAAQGLSLTHATGAAVRRLRVAYGPYLGLRCRRAGRPDCRAVGIDIVFRHAATHVAAWIGDRRVLLDTPGLHDGVPYRDWVGTFTRADFLPGGRFNLNDEPLYVAVELRVRYADGRCGRALFPHARVSPGWG